MTCVSSQILSSAFAGEAWIQASCGCCEVDMGHLLQDGLDSLQAVPLQMLNCLLHRVHQE
jgi:hypothetical protein